MSCAALDSSVYMVSFNLHLHRIPQLRLRVRFDPLSLAGFTVQSLWVHKLWMASASTFYVCFVGKITGKCIARPHRWERKDLKQTNKQTKSAFE